MMTARKRYTKPLIVPASEDEVIAHFTEVDLAAEPIPSTTEDRVREVALLSAVLAAVRRRGGNPTLDARIEERIRMLEVSP